MSIAASGEKQNLTEVQNVNEKDFGSSTGAVRPCNAVSGCGNSGSSSADSQSGSSATSENSASTEDTASTDGEVPTISLMVVCGTTPPDADAVAEKLSEITREKIGCNVEFITMEIGQRCPAAQSSPFRR